MAGRGRFVNRNRLSVCGLVAVIEPVEFSRVYFCPPRKPHRLKEQSIVEFASLSPAVFLGVGRRSRRTAGC